MRRFFRNRIVRKLIIAAVWLVIWQAAAWAVGSKLLLPSPFETGKALVLLAGTRVFWKSCLMTLLRVFAGFFLGVIAGAVLGVVTAASGFLDEFLSPLRSIVKATPVTSFIILVLLYLTSSLTPLFIAFLMVLPIVWSNVLSGIKATDAQLLEMADAFGYTKGKKLTRVYAPSVLPHFLSACTTGLGFAWKSGVTAEVIAHPAFGMGRYIYESKLYLETPELFAWTAAVIILSFALEKVVLLILGRAVKWK
ncbi:MAG: ABC transporter permease subunit [Clostridiales bacterium]|nr:ABC transporter permease subunit [Clostridiales bacterium]